MAQRQDVVRAAEELRRWAEGAGIFSQGRSAATTPQGEILEPGTMFSAGAAEAFVTKPITAVGFAASGRGEPCVFVYTRRKLTRAEEAGLSDNGLGVPVAFRVALPLAISTPVAPARSPVVYRNGRLCCGSSISTGNIREAGTLGALLKGADGTLYGLSCNHVTGGCSNARVDMPIVSPGILDVGAGVPHPRTIGFHRRALQFIQGDPSSVPTFHDNADAAIFEIGDPAVVSSWQGDAYDTPEVAAEPEENAPVEKVGRATGHTRGMVESRLVGPQRIDYNVTVHHSAEESIVFKGTVYFEPVYIVRSVDASFALNGDSGSIVVQREENSRPSAAVGLVVGGRGKEETYMLPLKAVVERLGLALVAGH